MRGKQLSAATVSTMLDRLLAQLAPDQPDPAGVQRPFAALVLAEVARFDRVEQFMTDRQLQQLVDGSTRYLQSIRDYRGFDEREGWRHGVAHASDLMLQLAVNPRTSKAQLDQMLAAIATQVAPAGEHYYIYGEGDRLAQAVFYIAKRKLHTADEWRQVVRAGRGARAAGELGRCVDVAARDREAPQHDGSSSRRCTSYVRESGPDFQELVLPSIVAAIKPLT